MSIIRPSWLLTGAVAGTSLIASYTQAGMTVAQQQAAEVFRMDHPAAQIMKRDGRIHKIVSKDLALGRDAASSAMAARESLVDMLGVDADEFIARGPFPDGRHAVNLMVDPATGGPKFTAFYWTQTADGIPVWRTRFMSLVRLVDGHPTVAVTSDLREVNGFVRPQDITPNFGLAVHAANEFVGLGASISEPEVVVYAGLDDMRMAPRPAMVFDAWVGTPADAFYAKRLLVVDLETGDLLHDENRIVHADGQCNGLCTQGSSADECAEEEAEGLPYARIVGGGQTVYTEADGSFAIDVADGTSVVGYLDGTWFNVNESSGDDTTSGTVSGGVVTLLHNAANSNEQYRAQVNAYLHSNIVRDYTLQYAPDFPVIGNQQGFPVNTGVSGSCNAFYDYSSINFYNAGGGCNNTAFSVVVHHEYGHHLVASAGSGQDAYGEGMGDVMGVLITGDAELARGFNQGDCENGIRSADNTLQYPCSGGIHHCGQVISGCVWDSLITVEAAFPGMGYDVVSELAINSMPMHSGGSIDPSILLDWLTLDDDDGDLENGTPHSEPLIEAFAMHSMDELPEPADNDFCSTAREVTWGSHSVNTAGALSDGDPYDESQCAGTYLGEMHADVWYRLVACGTGTMTVSTCDSVSFDSDLVVYHGDCDTMSQVACNGDGSGCGNYTSYLTVGVTEGETYLVRVGGWDGSSEGAGQLIIDGPGDPCDEKPSVVIDYPSGRPDAIDPEGGTQVAFYVDNGTGEPLPDTARLHTSINGGAWESSVVPGGGPDYLAEFDIYDCFSSVDWYISVETSDGVIVTSPSNAPDGSWSSQVYTDLVVSFEDDFESDMGWTVDAGAGTGNWQRATPANGGARCDNPTDADGSGMCYVTGNAADEDVDDGTTVLTSPIMDASSGGTLTYARWYSNGANCGGADPNNDHFYVDFSVNGGASWHNLETVGPTDESSGGWYYPAFDLDKVPGFTPTDQFRLRFSCGDLNDGSVVEAAVDAVLIEKIECIVEPACPSDVNGDGMTDANDILLVIGEWGGSGGDANGDGTTDTNDILVVIAGWGPC